MAAVWRHSKATLGTRLVLLAIADAANQQGLAWPSVPTLATQAKLSDRQVQRAIRWLERHGEVSTQRRERGNGSQTSWRFTVHVWGDNMSPGGDTHVTGGGDTHVTGILDPSRKEPSEKIYMPKRWRRRPAEEQLTPAREGTAKKIGVPVASIASEWDAMGDHEYKDAKSDVDACWRQWCRNWVKFNPQRKAASNGQATRAVPSVEATKAMLARMERR